MNQRPSDSTLPVVYAAALTGFVAAIFPALFVAIYGLASVGYDGWQGAVPLLTFSCFPAVVVMAFAGIPLHDLIQRFGLTNRWIYVGATSIIIGACYLLLVLLYPPLSDPFGVLLIGIAAVPSGLFFHHVTQRLRNVPALDWRDGLILGTWVVGWIAGWTIPFGSALPAYEFDPWHGRYEAVRLAFLIGPPAFVLAGVAAGIARLWSLRVSAGLVALAWTIPAGFAVDVFLTPVGTERVHFSVGDRDLWVDWRLKPYQFQAQLCFAAGGLYAGLHFTTNDNVCLSKAASALVPEAATVGDNRLMEAGLKCGDALFSGRPGKVCFENDAAGRTTTLIRCPPGYCNLQFDENGLRYSLILNPADFAAWNELRNRAVNAIAEATANRH